MSSSWGPPLGDWCYTVTQAIVGAFLTLATPFIPPVISTGNSQSFLFRILKLPPHWVSYLFCILHYNLTCSLNSSFQDVSLSMSMPPPWFVCFLRKSEFITAILFFLQALAFQSQARITSWNLACALFLEPRMFSWVSHTWMSSKFLLVFQIQVQNTLLLF